MGRNVSVLGSTSDAMMAPIPAMMLATRNAFPIPAASTPGAAVAELVAMLTSTAMPMEPPTSCPVVFNPDSMPVSSAGAPVSTDRATPTSATPRPTPAMTMPGRTSLT